MRGAGPFELRSVEAGRFKLDGGAMFGVVPRPLWQRALSADELGRVELALRLLLITDRRAATPRHILIDTGIGNKFDARNNDRFAVRPPEGGLRGAVRRCGVDPEEVTDVIVTHLHFDHAGGMIEADNDGEYRPTLPNATYHLQRRALKWAQHASEKDQRSFRLQDYNALSAGGGLHLLDGPVDLFEGVNVLLAEGHTVALQMPLIDGGEAGKVLFCSDTIPTTAHIQLPWIMAYDLYPLTTLEEKRLILAQALAEDWILFFEHDPEVEGCRLSEEAGEVVPGEPLTF